MAKTHFDCRLAGRPVPLIIMFAPSWGWVVFANVLLGINQGLCWSTTVILICCRRKPINLIQFRSLASQACYDTLASRLYLFVIKSTRKGGVI